MLFVSYISKGLFLMLVLKGANSPGFLYLPQQICNGKKKTLTEQDKIKKEPWIATKFYKTGKHLQV